MGAKYSQEDIRHALRSLAENGRGPTGPEYEAARENPAARPYLPSRSLVIQRHGTWNEALRAAGLQVKVSDKNRKRTFSASDCLEGMRRVAAKLPKGQKLTYQEYCARAAEEGAPSGQLVRNRFGGSWSKAKELAGLL